MSQDTWEFQQDKRIEVETLLEGMKPWLQEADGVTISGGEPFDQADALRVLVSLLRQLFKGDILVYSGYSFEHLQENYSAWLDEFDVLITDPYRSGAGQTRTMRGSDNQRIFLRSSLALSRYSPSLNEDLWEVGRKIDVLVENETFWMVGIPRPGDMDKLKLLLAQKGISGTFSHESKARA